MEGMRVGGRDEERKEQGEEEGERGKEKGGGRREGKRVGGGDEERKEQGEGEGEGGKGEGGGGVEGIRRKVYHTRVSRSRFIMEEKKRASRVLTNATDTRRSQICSYVINFIMVRVNEEP